MKNLISTTELAALLGISRVAVFQKIKKGDIPAKKVGRNFVIDKKDVAHLIDKKPSDKEKEEIRKAVKKTVSQYGETLKLLAKE